MNIDSGTIAGLPVYLDPAIPEDTVWFLPSKESIERYSNGQQTLEDLCRQCGVIYNIGKEK